MQGAEMNQMMPVDSARTLLKYNTRVDIQAHATTLIQPLVCSEQQKCFLRENPTGVYTDNNAVDMTRRGANYFSA